MRADFTSAAWTVCGGPRPAARIAGMANDTHVTFAAPASRACRRPGNGQPQADLRTRRYLDQFRRLRSPSARSRRGSDKSASPGRTSLVRWSWREKIQRGSESARRRWRVTAELRTALPGVQGSVSGGLLPPTPLVGRPPERADGAGRARAVDQWRMRTALRVLQTVKACNGERKPPCSGRRHFMIAPG